MLLHFLEPHDDAYGLAVVTLGFRLRVEVADIFGRLVRRSEVGIDVIGHEADPLRALRLAVFPIELGELFGQPSRAFPKTVRRRGDAGGVFIARLIYAHFQFEKCPRNGDRS